MLKNLTKFANGFLADVSYVIDCNISKEDSQYIDSILKYHFSTKGHMLRPTLAFLTAGALLQGIGGDVMKRLVNFAAAVELLHNASLVHDDVLDAEEMRRGEKCLHKVYGEKNSILTGNVYYIKAFEIIVDKLDIAQFKRTMSVAERMCYGEMLQNQYEGKAKPESVYFEIIRNKTAALTELACGEAAVISGATETVVHQMRRFGELTGMLYQLQDDYNDGDADVDAVFSYLKHAEHFKEEIDSIIDVLPASEYATALRGFIELLKGCIK